MAAGRLTDRADMAVWAAAPMAAGSSRGRAGAVPGEPPEIPIDKAGQVAVPKGRSGKTGPAAASEEPAEAVGKAAALEREAPGPGDGYRPWRPWAGRTPDTVRAGSDPAVSSRCSISGMASSEGAVAPAEDTAAGIGEVPRVERADRVADTAAGIGEVMRAERAGMAADTAAARQVGPEAPAAVHFAAEAG